MIPRQLIVVDVETSGLDPSRHTVLEVAWWNLDTGARGVFVPAHHVSTMLSLAEPGALHVNRYIERRLYDQPQDFNLVELTRLYVQFTDYDEDDVDHVDVAALTRHTLAGANPAFDAAFLENLMPTVYDNNGDARPWHHRLWDLSAYAAGVLRLDELPGLRTVCELLDIEPGDHTAEGDVTATGLCFLELRKRAAG